jgi:hypothetical protein
MHSHSECCWAAFGRLAPVETVTASRELTHANRYPTASFEIVVLGDEIGAIWRITGRHEDRRYRGTIATVR